MRAKLIEYVKKAQAREAVSIECHDKLRDVIAEKWLGKKANKRMVEHFKAKFSPQEASEMLVSWQPSVSSLYMYVWGIRGLTYDNRLMIHIGYDDTTFRGNGKDDTSRSWQAMTVEGFEQNNLCHGKAARERQAQREALLAGGIDAIAEAAQAVADAQAKLAALVAHGTPGNECRYADCLKGLLS